MGDVSERLPAERPSDLKKDAGSLEATTPSVVNEEHPSSGAFKKLIRDPGAARSLPPVLQQKFHGGERVRLTRAQDYADRRVEAGAEGLVMYPSSQAACWVVLFLADGKMRVVPGWDLQSIGAAKAAAH